MVASAIYELLNVSDITDIVSGVYFPIAPQGAASPYIYFEETVSPVNTKTGSSVREHFIDVYIVADKGRDGGGGLALVESIRPIVEGKLNRFTGMAGGKMIQDIYLMDINSTYDPISKKAIMLMEFKVRQDYDSALADPANYPLTVNVYTNGILQDTQVINAYNDNTINIT